MARGSVAAACLVIVLAMVTASPSVGADHGEEDEEELHCVNLVVDTFGDGLAVDLALWNAVGFTVTSGRPQSGFRIGVLVVPPLCGAGDIVKDVGDLVPSKLFPPTSEPVGFLFA